MKYGQLDMATDIKEQQTVAFKVANIFSIGRGKNANINDIPHLAIVVRYCCNYEEHYYIV